MVRVMSLSAECAINLAMHMDLSCRIYDNRCSPLIRKALTYILRITISPNAPGVLARIHASLRNGNTVHSTVSFYS